MVQFNNDMKKSGFEVMPEGVTILRVKEMKPIANMGKVKEYKGKFEDSEGRMVFNTYNMNPNNQYYLNSMRAFYSLLRTGCALPEDENGNIDAEEATGKFFVANIKHTENNGRVYANLGWINGHATSFDDAIEVGGAAPAVAAPTSTENEEDDDPYA